MRERAIRVAGGYSNESDESTGRPEGMPRATASREKIGIAIDANGPPAGTNRHAKRSTLWRVWVG
jgi:hypothetical protein